MTSIIRINQFVESANQAFHTPVQKRLAANVGSMGVRQVDISGPLTQAVKEENRQTWKIFRESLVDTIGQRKFDWICHRYRTSLNFTDLEKSGKHLLPEHVELFSIGSSQMLGRDIKNRFPEKLNTLSREQLTQRIRNVQPFSIVGGYSDQPRSFGSLDSMVSYFFHNKVLMDKRKQIHFSDIERLNFPAWLERMTKVLVSLELTEGQLIPAPGLDGRVDYFKVYKKVATGDGLVSYALKPAAANSTLKPLLLFRPSQWAFSNEDTFETYLNDVQPNIGEMGWTAAKSIFNQLMRDPHFRRNNESISISGYSLGGAHAQYFLTEHADHIANATFYSDPSIDEWTAKNFADRMNQAPRRTEPLNIQIFRMNGDFCHYVGGKHAGWGINHPDVNIQLMVVDHENKKAEAFQLHSHRIFDNANFHYQMETVEDAERLFNLLDNSKRGADVLWYERMRRVWGGIAFVSIYAISQLFKLTSWIFGVRILRSSKHPDL